MKVKLIEKIIYIGAILLLLSSVLVPMLSKSDVIASQNETIIASPDFDRLILATVQIKIGKRGGAGIIIRDDGKFLYILTVKHAITQKGRLDVCVRDIDRTFHIVKNIKKECIYQHKIVDLALIKVPRPKGEYVTLKIAPTKPTIGTVIYTIGHPLNFHFTVNTGIVSNYLTNPLAKRRGTYMLISAPSFTGNSGGAVINERTEVVGISAGIMYLGNNPSKYEDTTYLFYMTFAIQLDDIKELMKVVLPKYNVSERHKILK